MDAVEQPPSKACECCLRPATHSRRRLCRACYMAISRATRRGESFEEAAEHRRTVLGRKAKGWVR